MNLLGLIIEDLAFHEILTITSIFDGKCFINDSEEYFIEDWLTEFISGEHSEYRKYLEILNPEIIQENKNTINIF